MNERDDKYSDREAKQRTEAALRGAFSAPHKTYEETKLGKRKPKPTKKKIKRRHGA
jgi:hypothetical protein